MTVGNIRKLLKGLPSDMEVVIPLGEDNFVTVCAENSAVITLQQADDEEDDDGEPVEVLLLVGCTCVLNEDVEPIISEDQLN